jgi:hypothetical protein
MSIWLRGSLLVNPYYRTAFRVARVPREIVRHRTVVQLIGQTRQLPEGGHSIAGEPVRPSEVNAAEQVLLDPVLRVLEELIEHATEKPPVERLRKLQREATAAMAPPPEALDGKPDWTVLKSLGQVCIEEFLRTAPRSDASFGALELETPPPFGPRQEE